MSCTPRLPADDPRSPAADKQAPIEKPAAPDADGAKPARGRARHLARGLPEGLHVLVAEHNSILALDVEDMLQRHGVARVATASTAGEALAQLREATFDAALLDLNLPGSGTVEVALCLQERGIPFAFAIGYGERVELPASFSDRLVIGKPYSEPYLVSRLAALLAGRS